MKVIIVGYSLTGGGKERIKAFRTFLQGKNHDVTVIQFPGNTFSSKTWYYYQRVQAKLRDHEKRFMTKTADKIEKIVNEGHYDAVIAVETPFAQVLTRDLGCLKIFSFECPEAELLYFAKKRASFERIRSLREMEIEIMQKSDYVLFPWKTTEDYVRRHAWDGNNFLTVKYGCYPREKVASYFFPVSMVSLGSLWGEWSNKELMSYLTRISPYAIDVYGYYKPPRKYHINYKGFAKSLDILRNYQFGLNTISKDLFRRNHHASRIMTYLAYGLPVLSPDWLQFSNELKGVLPFNEQNFLDVVEKYSDRDLWEKLSKEAFQQACDLDWNIVLEPLEKLLSK